MILWAIIQELKEKNEKAVDAINTAKKYIS